MVNNAERIALSAHAGQTERLTGAPYHHHLARVVALVDGDDAKAVAWLHDVLEDTAVTAEGLRAEGVSEAVIEAVNILTRDPARSYHEYIKDIQAAQNPLALTVKIADLHDHLRPMGQAVLPTALRRRYDAALKYLLDADTVAR